MSFLNLGIMAHVDAGKTSLTERLLYTTGVITSMGSVDTGTTQTDTMALERQRGITIKAAVVSFHLDDLTVNVIDTPGHPDFIAEVERSLAVLDGAILVISAVEGVQPQTRVLMRALQRLRIPTLLFINKIDRRGADLERVLAAIRVRLSKAVVCLGEVTEAGTRQADFQPLPFQHPSMFSSMVELLAEQNETLLADYVADERSITPERLRHELAAQTSQALIYPVLCGSAITGAGIAAVIDAIRTLLPRASIDAAAPVAGSIFKIERGTTGEKIAYVRLYAGTLHIRDQVPLGHESDDRITALRVFEHGTASKHSRVQAGQIGKLWGLASARIGDRIGQLPVQGSRQIFTPPTLETMLVPENLADRNRLHSALLQLAEQDPLINLRIDEQNQELYVSLYGEVQKEVIQATLANEYGIAVTFKGTTTIYIEQLVGHGEALDVLGKGANPFVATVGLRLEPGPLGSGITFKQAAAPGSIPTYLFRSGDLFSEQIASHITDTLRQGLYGWQVQDCAVTMTQSGFAAPATTPRDYRLLTPLVVMDALQQAGTIVCEPLQHFSLEVPADTLGQVLPTLVRLDGSLKAPVVHGNTAIVEGTIASARIHELQQQLPGLSRGEGMLEYEFDHYEPVHEPFPTRRRTDNNPLNRKEYLLAVLRRVYHMD